ncbi:MAG: hypothetical protein K8S99_07740 [Planctomycetes bacterium]|nr:hypothetical protein [Planctomycetota bacterium]
MDTLGRHMRPETLKLHQFARLQGVIGKTYTPPPSNRLKTTIITRMMFSWCAGNGHLDRRLMPVFGSEFIDADHSEIYEARHDRGRHTFTAGELRSILKRADVHLKAAVLLGINGGYTQKEIAGLTFKVMDLDAAIIDTCAPRRA